jgi:hypothetical protein
MVEQQKDLWHWGDLETKQVSLTHEIPVTQSYINEQHVKPNFGKVGIHASWNNSFLIMKYLNLHLGYNM